MYKPGHAPTENKHKKCFNLASITFLHGFARHSVIGKLTILPPSEYDLHLILDCCSNNDNIHMFYTLYLILTPLRFVLNDLYFSPASAKMFCNQW